MNQEMFELEMQSLDMVDAYYSQDEFEKAQEMCDGTWYGLEVD